MKLRNKKTGAIIIPTDYTFATYDDGIRYGHRVYDSLAEFNEEWEDYTPKEPLIKDEKIRKAVRAWAEANGVERVFIGFNNRDLVAKFREGQSISFGSSLPLDRGRNYTITELCGEEENEVHTE